MKHGRTHSEEKQIFLVNSAQHFFQQIMILRSIGEPTLETFFITISQITPVLNDFLLVFKSFLKNYMTWFLLLAMQKGESPGMFTRVLVKRLPKRVKAKRRYFIYDNACNCHKYALRRYFFNIYVINKDIFGNISDYFFLILDILGESETFHLLLIVTTKETTPLAQKSMIYTSTETWT